MFTTAKKLNIEVVQKKPTPNRTGIPSTMKQRFEIASGFSLDDVRVHYHSDQPARLHALAYTRGAQVHIAPGQERHLPHELSHVVQQKSGIVQPTAFINHIPVNASPALERQAARGISGVRFTSGAARTGCTVAQRLAIMAQVPLSEGEKVQFDKLIKVAEAEQCGSGAVDYASVRRLLHNDAPEICVNDPYETIAFLGHACPEFIGCMTPDVIVATVKKILENSNLPKRADEAAHSAEFASPVPSAKMPTGWRGAIYLMGCQTGRAYRRDESQPVPPDQESLADKVAACYNRSISPDVSDVVGTFLRLFAVSENPHNKLFHGAYIDYINHPKIKALFGTLPAGELPPTPKQIQVLRLIHDIDGAFNTMTKIVGVYLYTNTFSAIWPMTGSSPSELRLSALDYATKAQSELWLRLTDAMDKLPATLLANAIFFAEMDSDIKTVKGSMNILLHTLTQINNLIQKLAIQDVYKKGIPNSLPLNWQPNEPDLQHFIDNHSDSISSYDRTCFADDIKTLFALTTQKASLMRRNYMSLDPSAVHLSISTIPMKFSSVDESYHTQKAARLARPTPST